MSDLDKMMAKLKKPKEDQVEDPVEDPDEEEDEDNDEVEEETPKKTPKEDTPKEDQKVDVEQEIAILQNNGIFRREILGAVRELINVQMVTAQSLIDLNKLITGALNGKKK